LDVNLVIVMLAIRMVIAMLGGLHRDCAGDPRLGAGGDTRASAQGRFPIESGQVANRSLICATLLAVYCYSDANPIGVRRGRRVGLWVAGLNADLLSDVDQIFVERLARYGIGAKLIQVVNGLLFRIK
jgi:hypothetical protein